MIYDVVLYPDAPLCDKAKEVTEFGDDLIQLAEDMIETMFDYQGVGLAAPQIGLSKRLLVFCEPESEPMCIVNPEIYESEGKESGDEGCLSMPSIYGQVPRATRIKIKGFNEKGKAVDFEALDFLARIIQHEVDHLDGIMFPDRMDILSREDMYSQWNEVREQLMNERNRLSSEKEINSES